MGRRNSLSLPYKRLRSFERLKEFLEEAQRSPAPVYTQGGSSRKHPGAKRAGWDAGAPAVAGSVNAGAKANV